MLPLRVKIFISFLFAKTKDFNYSPSGATNQRVYVFLAADYGNLGDVAISYAQSEFLKARFPDAEIVEIPISKTLSGIKAVRKAIKCDDIITMVGGGNMGDMYDDIEFLRELVVVSFRRNKIISFPQTIDFSTTKFGRRRLRFARFVYASHKHITLFARESVSYKIMKDAFPTVDVKIGPDIVMTLDCRNHALERNGVLLCMRDDKEKKDVDIISVRNYFEQAHKNIIEYDTHIGREKLSPNESLEELKKIWSAFSKSELVVTDRLHGMIFAFITGTPALVFPNANHKVRSCYEWIKDCGFINLISDANMVSFPNVKDNFESSYRFIQETLEETFHKII